MSFIGDLLNKAQYVAGVLDKPGRVVRNALGGNNPVNGLTDFSTNEVVNSPAAPSGRDLLEQYGVLGPNTPGFDMGDVAGLAAEIATDPLTYLGGLGLAKKGLALGSKAAKGAKAIGGAAAKKALPGAARKALPGSVRGAIAAAEEAKALPQAAAKALPGPSGALVPAGRSATSIAVRQADEALPAVDDVARSLVDEAASPLAGKTRIIDVTPEALATAGRIGPRAAAAARMARNVGANIAVTPGAIRAANSVVDTVRGSGGGNPEDYPADLGEQPAATASPASGYVLRGALQGVMPDAGVDGVGSDPKLIANEIGRLNSASGQVNGGTLKQQPWYQDYLTAMRANANMTQDQRVASGMPTQIASVNQRFSDPRHPGSGETLNADAALQVARKQADQNIADREKARIARANSPDDPIMQRARMNRSMRMGMSPDMAQGLEMMKYGSPEEFRNWMMMNNAPGLADIINAQAKQQEVLNNSPQTRLAAVKGDPVGAAAAGVSQEAIDAGKLQDEITAGTLGSQTRKTLSDMYGQDWAIGPQSLGSKQAFLQHVANSGLGISPEIASQWWAENVVGQGMHGLLGIGQ